MKIGLRLHGCGGWLAYPKGKSATLMSSMRVLWYEILDKYDGISRKMGPSKNSRVPRKTEKTLCPENMGHRTNSRAPPNFSDVPCFTNIIFFECLGFSGGPVPMSRLSWITCFFVLVGSYIKLSSSLNFFVLP